jgi:hypothetical protein
VLVDDEARAEVLGLCQRLIRVDTTNPPGRHGDCAAAARLRRQLSQCGHPPPVPR